MFASASLLALNWNARRRIHPDAHLVAFDTEYRDGNRVTDLERLANAAYEDVHDELRVG